MPSSFQASQGPAHSHTQHASNAMNPEHLEGVALAGELVHEGYWGVERQRGGEEGEERGRHLVLLKPAMEEQGGWGGLGGSARGVGGGSSSSSSGRRQQQQRPAAAAGAAVHCRWWEACVRAHATRTHAERTQTSKKARQGSSLGLARKGAALGVLPAQRGGRGGQGGGTRGAGVGGWVGEGGVGGGGGLQRARMGAHEPPPTPHPPTHPPHAHPLTHPPTPHPPTHPPHAHPPTHHDPANM